MGASALRSIRILLGVGIVGAALTFAYVNNFFDGLIEALRGERQLAEASVSDPSLIAESLQGVFSGGDIDPLLDEVFLEPLLPSAEFNQAANGSGQTADTTNTEDDTQSLLGEEAQNPEVSSAGGSVLADAATSNSSVSGGQVNPSDGQDGTNTASNANDDENAKSDFLVPGAQGTSTVAADAELLPEPRRQTQNGTAVGDEGDWRAQLIDEHTKRLFEAVLEREFNAVQDQKDREQLADRGPLGQSLHGVNEGRQQDVSSANSNSAPMESTTSASAPSQPENISIAPGVPYSQGANSGLRYGKTLTAGSLIPAVLVDDINSELPGLVRAMVVRDVYDSDTLERLMIPRGSTLLGSYENQTANNQSRLFVYWTQLRLPNGRTVDLERAAGVDTNGAVGLTGRRSNGFAKSVLQATLLNLASNAARGGAAETSPSDIEKAAQIALGQSLGSVAEQRLEQSLSQGVRFRIPAGTNFNVQIKNDFEISGTSLRPSSTRFADADTKDGASSSGQTYDRKDYAHWIDEDGDCQNLRHELLQQYSTGNTTLTADGCAVTRGRWLDPYSGQVFTAARDVQIDHVVPLAWAHVRGAAAFSENQKMAFANDPVNLLVVSGQLNQQKGAASPLNWLPPNEAFQCQYVLRFNRVVSAYDLTPFEGEADALGTLQQRLCV